jgi:hypothetical protein
MTSKPDPSTQPETSDNPPPLDTLLNLIVTCLAPMFLTATAGNIHFARQAAIQSVDAYRARDHADLFAIAQIIACGFTALFSLSLSLGDDLSLSMILRLRGNAVALNRAAEQNRRALTAPRPAHQTPFATESESALSKEKVLDSVESTKQPAIKTQADLQPKTPEPSPAAAKAPTPRQHQAMWAFAMTDVAQEVNASLKNLPPIERKLASRRAAALSSCANQLLLGNGPPPLQPGDLAEILLRAKTR